MYCNWSNTEFEILVEASRNSLSYCIRHFFSAQFMSVCPEILNDTALRDILLLFSMVREWSILCYIALLIRHESWYCRIVNLLLDNWGQPRYGVSLGHDNEYFVEGRNFTSVPLINSHCGRVSLNKKQMFHCQFIYIPWIGKYWNSKRIQLCNKINAHKS